MFNRINFLWNLKANLTSIMNANTKTENEIKQAIKDSLTAHLAKADVN